MSGPGRAGGAAGGSDAARREVLQALAAALALLGNRPIGPLIPEVRSNLGYALPGAAACEEVAAFPGRITDLDGFPATVAAPRFGASRHIAKVILAAMRRHPELRAAMNVRCDRQTLAACFGGGLRLVRFDRREEPAAVRRREGASLEWGTAVALEGEEAQGPPPDGVWDEGSTGKEPMIRILGRTPQEVAQKVLVAWRALPEAPLGSPRADF